MASGPHSLTAPQWKLKLRKKGCKFSMTCSYRSIKKKYFIRIQYVKHIAAASSQPSTIPFFRLNLLICLEFGMIQDTCSSRKKVVFCFTYTVWCHSTTQEKILHKILTKYEKWITSEIKIFRKRDWDAIKHKGFTCDMKMFTPIMSQHSKD